MLTPQLFYPQTHDGWRLELRRYLDPERHLQGRAPVLFIPGYGMNTYILAYHPDGVSMVGALVEAGYEVWTANLRGQGGASRAHGVSRGADVGLTQLALTDVPCARDFVLSHSGADKIVFIGCSLGASILYAYLAHHPDDHRAAGMIAIGGPLRWLNPSALMRLLFKSPTLAGLVPFKGTRQAINVAMPLLRRAPGALSMYMNARQIDLRKSKLLTPTVDDPIPRLNRQIALWLRRQDLVVKGLNIPLALKRLGPLPMLCLLANRDGVVPPEAALSVLEVRPPAQVEVVIAGDEDTWFAHADLFIAPKAYEWVFAPMISWLDQLEA